MSAPGLWWIGRDLRLDDNDALAGARAEGPLWPVFLVDAALRAQGAASRWRLGRGLAALDADLRARSGGRGVTVIAGEAEDVLPRLIRAHGTRRIHHTDWPAPAMRAAQDRLRAALGSAAELVLHPGHLLTLPGAIRTGEGGVYRVYSPFARALNRIGADRPGPEAPARLALFDADAAVPLARGGGVAPLPRETGRAGDGEAGPTVSSDAERRGASGEKAGGAAGGDGVGGPATRRSGPARSGTAGADGGGLVRLDPATLDLAPDLRGGRAALERFALEAGERAAARRLVAFLARAAAYPQDRDRPDRAATSALSEALAVGEIGPRRLWATASAFAEAHPAQAAGVHKFLSELVWREFAWHLLVDFPQMPARCWRPEWERFPWAAEGAGLERWRRAATGVALVDAGLREMWLTGRMHNRVRMVVASWLTKNELIDWRAGMAHFDDCLTDWDPASNAMNWQWVAGCGPDAAPYFRIFNPERQAETFDPEGRYRRRWLAGFGGATSETAAAWEGAIPSAWRGAPWRAVGAERLSGSRARALAALEAFKASDAP